MHKGDGRYDCPCEYCKEALHTSSFAKVKKGVEHAERKCKIRAIFLLQQPWEVVQWKLKDDLDNADLFKLGCLEYISEEEYLSEKLDVSKVQAALAELEATDFDDNVDRLARACELLREAVQNCLQNIKI